MTKCPWCVKGYIEVSGIFCRTCHGTGEMEDMQPEGCNECAVWYKPSEVVEPGLYIVLDPLDTVPGADEPATVVLQKVGNVIQDRHQTPLSGSFYSKCVFFGPIPIYQK